MLHVKGNRIIDEKGERVRLRGTNLGAWMIMEDFMNAIPGSEHQLRSNAKRILGGDLGEYWFDCFLDHFITEEDICFLQDLGCNVVRLPLNYHHFENDREPYQYLKKGFQRVDRILEICGKHGIYVILDMHAAPGGQNSSWCCDNEKQYGLFWNTMEYRDRFVKLWGVLAQRYKDNKTVAGYDLLNEPKSNQINGETGMPFDYYEPDWDTLNEVHRQAVTEIRKYDKEHILFLEGDLAAHMFEGLETTMDDNIVVSSHNYSRLSAPTYVPTFIDLRDDEKTIKQYREEFYQHEGTKYALKHNLPLYIGEFQLNLPQLKIFNEEEVHWTNWSYKASNFGIVQPADDCKYFQVIAPVITKLMEVGKYSYTPERKKMLSVMEELYHAYIDSINDQRVQYGPLSFVLKRTLDDVNYAPVLQLQFISLFKDMSKEEIDEIMSSWDLGSCVKNEIACCLLKQYWNADR